MSHITLLHIYWVSIPVLSYLFAIVVLQLLQKSFLRTAIRESEGAVVVIAVILAAPTLWNAPFVNPFGEPIVIVHGSNRQVVAVIQGRQLLPRWDRLYLAPGNQVIDISPAVDSVSMYIQPITPNPKVRQLSYRVWFGAVGTAEDRVRYVNKLGRFDPSGPHLEAQKYVQYWLYEFEEHHSKELAQLYNPLDSGQQEHFVGWVKEYLQPKLRDVGLTFVDARFDMSNEPKYPY